MVSIARKNLFHEKIRFLIALAGIQFSVLLITIRRGQPQKNVLQKFRIGERTIRRIAQHLNIEGGGQGFEKR